MPTLMVRAAAQLALLAPTLLGLAHNCAQVVPQAPFLPYPGCYYQAYVWHALWGVLVTALRRPAPFVMSIIMLPPLVRRLAVNVMAH